MSAVRTWIVLLTVVSFLAGTASGVLVGGALRPAPAPAEPFSDYCDLLVRTYDLSPERARGLRMFMTLYARELEDAKSRRTAAMDAELSALGRKYRQLIRDFVVPEGRREEFDQLATSGSVAAL